jgi:hypothetical protein
MSYDPSRDFSGVTAVVLRQPAEVGTLWLEAIAAVAYLAVARWFGQERRK